MTVSKRLRYEILRRDDHTCRYCGGRAPAGIRAAEDREHDQEGPMS